MPSSLLSLQPELQLTIAEFLTPDLSGLHDEDVQDRYDAKGERAPSRDDEIWRRKKDNIRNLLSWSCTSRFFRTVLIPYIFKTLVLRNTNRNAASVQMIASDSEFAKYTRELRFIGYAPGDAKRDDPAFSDVENVLPNNAKEILADLRQFPNLQTLSLEFDYDFEDYDEWEEEGVNPANNIELGEMIWSKEGQEAWRALMMEAWEAVSQNRDGVVKHLEINKIYYKEVSTFNESQFHDFLGHLESFSLSIFGGDNGAGWKTNTCEAWEVFIGKLDTYFFDHLSNITSFTLKANEEGPIGLSGMNHAPFPLRQEHMPKLQALHLEWMFLSPELRDFITTKAGTLESIHLRSCLAEIDDAITDENSLYWHELFDAISATEPRKLRTFKITDDWLAPLPKNKNDCNKYDSKIEEEDDDTVNAQIEEARKTVERGEKRVWAHVCIDDKYGMLFEDVEENFISFREGRDQAAYERLMGIVENNNDMKSNRKVARK